VSGLTTGLGRSDTWQVSPADVAPTLRLSGRLGDNCGMDGSRSVTGSAGPGRDRDDSGRPRNSRPRDALGRPLPRGLAGVPRAAEGLRRSPEQTLREGQGLLEAGLPFHAHEVFEDAWKMASESDRELWRGLAQLAVALTHAARGNPVGAAALLRRAATTMAPYAAAAPYRVDVAGLVAWAGEAVRRLEDGADPQIDPPRLRGSSDREPGDPDDDPASRAAPDP
jgi:hypothetical protein